MSCADQEEGERGGFPWKFLEEGDLKPQPPTLWKILTSQIYIPVAKLQKKLMNFVNLKTSWLAFIIQDPLVNQNHSIYLSWSLGSQSSTLFTVSLDWHQLLYKCC